MSAEHRKGSRRSRTVFLERAAVGLIILDVVFYFVLVSWMGGRVRAAQIERDTLLREAIGQEQRVRRLLHYQQSLPGAEQKIQDFVDEHVPPRQRGFSRGARLLNDVAGESGVQLGGVRYQLDTKHPLPLERLAMEVSAQGSFDGLVKFAHGLETADDFLVLREFSLLPGDGGNLALKLSLDMYLEP